MMRQSVRNFALARIIQINNDGSPVLGYATTLLGRQQDTRYPRTGNVTLSNHGLFSGHRDRGLIQQFIVYFLFGVSIVIFI